MPLCVITASVKELRGNQNSEDYRNPDEQKAYDEAKNESIPSTMQDLDPPKQSASSMLKAKVVDEDFHPEPSPTPIYITWGGRQCRSVQREETS
jgi:hypothetical protein